MNNSSPLAVTVSATIGVGRRFGLLALLGVGAALGGCAERAGTDAVTLYARAVSARDPRLLEIQAQVAGSLEGVHYKWFAVSGECNPQETSVPVTRFRFATAAKDDQITVDVLRHGKRIGRGTLDVRMAAVPAPAAPLNLTIEMTEIPLAAKGGPDTRANIAGRIVGELPPDSRVVIYARDDGVWFIQPTTNAKHSIASDGSWSSWTHSGMAYAILVVPADFVPLRNLDSIPGLRSDIFARAVIDGRAK
jgi:hypothetical protein